MSGRWMALSIAVLLFLTQPAGGAVLEITVEGQFASGFNEEFFGLPPGTPFTLRGVIDTEVGSDNEPANPALGRYWSETPITLDFGGYHFENSGTEVRVYSAYQGEDAPVSPQGDPQEHGAPVSLWGITFGNFWAFEHAGLSLPAYFGLYASFIQPFNPAVAPTDELQWLWLSQDSEWNDATSYTYIQGTTGDGLTVNWQQDGVTYSVREVPEPEAVVLLGLMGVMGLMGRRTRPPSSVLRPPS